MRRLCRHSERSFDSAGRNADRDTVDYSLAGSETLQAFGILAALGTIAFSLGDTVLPEVQATCKVPDPKLLILLLTCYHLKLNFLTSKLVLCWNDGDCCPQSTQAELEQSQICSTSNITFYFKHQLHDC